MNKDGFKPAEGRQRAGNDIPLITEARQRKHGCHNKYCLADYLKVCHYALRGKCIHNGNGYSCPHFVINKMCYEIPDWKLYFVPFDGGDDGVEVEEGGV